MKKLFLIMSSRTRSGIQKSWIPAFAGMTFFAGMTMLLCISALAQENPYHEGTARTQLTAEEKENLLQYLTSSKATLERAKKKAKDKSLEEVYEIYASSIKDVVLRSSQSEKSRGELLLRYALNQALELTVGIPTPDGKSVEKEGILSQGPIDLNIAILENSIDFALSYYPKDKEAVDSGSLLNLPFFEFSQKRLMLAKEEWLTGIHSWKGQLEFEVAILEQWFLTVQQEQNLEKERIASLIIDVDEALTKVKSETYTVGQKVRYLRGVIRSVIKDGQAILLRHPERSEGSPSQPSDPRNVTTSPSELLGDFVHIPAAGTIMMGSPKTESGRGSDENQHQVIIPKDFQIMKTEVTQKMWVSIMGENPSYFKGDYLPVEQVSWNDVQVFIDRLNRKNDGYTYRLPTEAEWEYAARAGTQTAYSFGNNAAVLGDYAWFDGNSGSKTHEVASAPSKERPNANAWGLYDMHGNVWEWVLDPYSRDYSTALSQENANAGAFGTGSSRVLRGGGWDDGAPALRSANRFARGPDSRYYSVGFRLVRSKN